MKRISDTLFVCFLVSLLPLLAVADQSGPQGTWVTTITESDAPPEMQKETVGIWELSLGEGNQFSVSKKGDVVVKGEYKVDKDQIVFTDKEGTMKCSDAEKTGTYKWTIEEKNLTFTSVDDKCKGRKLVLLTHPLKKKGSGY